MSFGSYHHLAERLLPSFEWVDGALFSRIRKIVNTRILSQESPNVTFDVALRHIGPVTLSQYRCDILVGGTSWLLVFEDHISRTTRLRACIPAAISESVDECCVLNARTGELHTLRLVDPRVFRARMGISETVG